MSKENPEINCSTFQKQESVINDITDRVNKAQGIQEKVKFALELRKEITVLLSCPDYKKGKLDCESCRFIASLREKVALLIIRAQKLT